MPQATPAHAETALRARALAYPETHEDFPWGESALKVRNKVFLFMRRDPTGLGLSLKLPQSADAALLLPFCEPTGYGLGKAGWVSAKFGPKDNVPTELLLEWLDESYRAVAPASVVKKLGQLPIASAVPSAKKKRAGGKAVAPRPTGKAKPKAKAKPKRAAPRKRSK